MQILKVNKVVVCCATELNKHRTTSANSGLMWNH